MKAILENSVNNGWCDFYPLKNNNKANHNSNNTSSSGTQMASPIL